MEEELEEEEDQEEEEPSEDEEEDVTTKHCPKCGAVLEEHDKVCPECGAFCEHASIDYVDYRLRVLRNYGRAQNNNDDPITVGAVLGILSIILSPTILFGLIFGGLGASRSKRDSDRTLSHVGIGISLLLAVIGLIVLLVVLH